MREPIARDMFFDELIVRHVSIERADQIIPILPHMRNGVILFVTIGLGEADQVHPVPSPTLAKMR